MERNYHDEQQDVILEQLCSVEQVLLSIDDSLKLLAKTANDMLTKQNIKDRYSK